MSITIAGYRITRYAFPRRRPIGDSQIRVDTHYIGALELHASDGHTGLGFFGALVYPLPPLGELERVFATEVAPGLLGQSPFALCNRLSRPRGGNIRANLFGQAVDQALWDLQGKALDMRPGLRPAAGAAGRVRRRPRARARTAGARPDALRGGARRVCAGGGVGPATRGCLQREPGGASSPRSLLSGRSRLPVWPRPAG